MMVIPLKFPLIEHIQQLWYCRFDFFSFRSSAEYSGNNITVTSFLLGHHHLLCVSQGSKRSKKGQNRSMEILKNILREPWWFQLCSSSISWGHRIGQRDCMDTYNWFPASVFISWRLNAMKQESDDCLQSGIIVTIEPFPPRLLTPTNPSSVRRLKPVF